MTIQEYISAVNKLYKAGIATEHSYRGDLKILLESLVSGITVTNEPSHIACGAPDYIITRKNIPIGYVEAKDINKPLDGKEYKEQFDRYRNSLPNLIITDYLEFRLFRDGEFVTSVRIGNAASGAVVGLPENYDTFARLITDFCAHISQTIKSSSKLAKMMAGKARLLANVIQAAIESDENSQQHQANEDANNTLRQQMAAFRDILIHDIKPNEFADIYAQTIAYGMFAARLHDPTMTDFTRQEAAELIPKSNPFLRKLFQYVAGYDLDDRIRWIVDDLADIFRACDVAAILNNFGKSTQQEDPVIHFYETFLSEYNPALRKARGVWYTPQPVVNFIVRAVDDILKTEFGLTQGLADNSKIRIKVNESGKLVEKEVHRVQILDPACGTGTFLAEVIRQVYAKFQGQQGIWPHYAEEHLIPRLNGFELLMASYAMAHLKLGLQLKETGYEDKSNKRLRVYLTNSLEEYHPDTGTLFAGWLSDEANEANRVKRDTPVMVVLGNPPYSVSSSNKSKWIEGLLADYKKDLNEKNIQPLSDDYIKFIRFGQHFIDKNGSGILAYISNNSFIDGLIHRQMRKSLLESFDKIYILDLHGNAKKKEVCPDGSPDQNVFDIMQGVSINLFIKTSDSNKPGVVKHFDLFGKRDEKYLQLNKNDFNSIHWDALNPDDHNAFLVPKDFGLAIKYNQGFKIDSLFNQSANGIKTQRDDASIAITKLEQTLLFTDFIALSESDLKTKYGFIDVRDWKVSSAKDDLIKNPIIEETIQYRPFDFRFMNYTGKTKGIMGYPRYNIMQHFVEKENVGFIGSRQFGGGKHFICFITSKIIEISSQPFAPYNLFPLYLYSDTDPKNSFEFNSERIPNFNIDIISQISTSLNLHFTNEKEETPGTFAPIDILDYIYAVLHSPAYRAKYKEFLKIDFPRVPYPENAEQFWALVKLGGELRQLHLLESPKVNEYITQYPVAGDNVVEKPKYEAGRVYINDTQYFDNVPEVAWNFYIGGYQPAQKWLKDRKGRTLSFDNILHYQRVIVALNETERVMGEVDEILKI